MLSHINPSRQNDLSPELFAICLLLACSLQIMENLIPKIPIFPWLRLGLSYWIMLPFLLRFGLLEALLLFLSRNLITLVYGGQVFTSFLISTGAGFCSFILVGAILKSAYQKRILGLLGVSVLLATSFNCLQLFMVDQLFIQHADFYFQLAPLLGWSLISGSLIAFLIERSEESLNGLFSSTFFAEAGQFKGADSRLDFKQKIELLVSIATLVLIFTLESLLIQFSMGVLLLMITRLTTVRTLLFAWPFYFYIAWLHLFRTDGFYILGEWITQEGLDAFLFYLIRTMNIITCGQWFGRFVPSLVGALKLNRYLKGLGYAVPLLPSIFGISIALGKELLGKARKREFENLLQPLVVKLTAEFQRNKTG